MARARRPEVRFSAVGRYAVRRRFDRGCLSQRHRARQSAEALYWRLATARALPVHRSRPDVKPAEGKPDVVAPGELTVTGITVHLQDSREALEMTPRTFRHAVGC